MSIDQSGQTPPSPPVQKRSRRRSRAILRPIEGFLKEIRNTVRGLVSWGRRVYAAWQTPPLPRTGVMPELSRREQEVLMCLNTHHVGQGKGTGR